MPLLRLVSFKTIDLNSNRLRSVSPNDKLFGDTVSRNNKLFGDTVSPNNFFLYKMHTRNVHGGINYA